MKAGTLRMVVTGCRLLVFLLCVSASAGAETRFGGTAGLNWSTLRGDGPENANYNRALGFSVGLVGDIALSKDIYLSVEPIYVRRGTDISLDVGEDEPRDSLEARLDYVDCLVMVKVLPDNGATYVSSGLGIGFLTKATLKDTRGEEADAKNLFENIDLFVAFGVGFMIPARSSPVTVELRYQQSLLSISEPNPSVLNSDLVPRMRFSGFQLRVAVLFPRSN